MIELLFKELAKVGVSVAAKELLVRIINNWGDSALTARGLIRALSKDDCYLSYLSKHVAGVIKLRTIHSSERDVLLSEIYHPLRIVPVGGGEEVLSVNDECIFENNNIVNIIGVAGQGKSTILRKLFLEQIKFGSKLPFFIELRKAEGTGIINALIECLSVCGLKVQQDAVQELLKSNKVILMLDGFDEITVNNRQKILSEILDINIRYETQIITTTRPGTLLCNAVGLINYRVKNLNQDDIFGIINKLNSRENYIEGGQLDKIKNVIRENKNLTSVMTSPILVTLFHICYPFMDIIPNNTIDFYSNLFMTLYLRHDKVKNFTREKSASLSHTEAYECFCTLCFLSLYKNEIDFNELKLHKYAEDAMKLKGKLEGNKPEYLVSDFINVTCLIQPDGYDRFSFIHKSIQEFHAADFIKNVSSEKKIKLYELMRNDLKNKESRFGNLVTFLYEVDELDCSRWVLVPICEEHGVNRWNDFGNENIKLLAGEIFHNVNVVFSSKPQKDKSNLIGFAGNIEGFQWLSNFTAPKNSVSYFVLPLYDYVFQFTLNKTIEIFNYLNSGGGSMSFLEFVTFLECEKGFYKELDVILKKIYKDLYELAKSRIKNEEDGIDVLFEFNIA